MGWFIQLFSPQLLEIPPLEWMNYEQSVNWRNEMGPVAFSGRLPRPNRKLIISRLVQSKSKSRMYVFCLLL